MPGVSEKWGEGHPKVAASKLSQLKEFPIRGWAF